MIKAIKNWLERRNAMRRFEAAIKERDRMRAACKHVHADGRSAWVKVAVRPSMQVTKVALRPSMQVTKGVSAKNHQRQPSFTGTPTLSASCSICHRHWQGSSFDELERLLDMPSALARLKLRRA